MRPIELSPRLRSVADLVPEGAVLADIGTDHAFLPVYLLQHDRIPRAVAADLREGPLNTAREHAAKYGLTERMRFCLCDGLSGLRPEDADTIAIAGMGGETIAAILAAAPWTRDGAHRLLLQPMSSVDELRKFFWETGYEIKQEHLNREGRRLYLTMEVGAGACRAYRIGEACVGLQWKGMDSPLRAEYLQEQRQRHQRALEGLERSGRAEDAPRLAHLRALVAELNELEEEWKTWQR